MKITPGCDGVSKDTVSKRSKSINVPKRGIEIYMNFRRLL